MNNWFKSSELLFIFYLFFSGGICNQKYRAVCRACNGMRFMLTLKLKLKLIVHFQMYSIFSLSFFYFFSNSFSPPKKNVYFDNFDGNKIGNYFNEAEKYEIIYTFLIASCCVLVVRVTETDHQNVHSLRIPFSFEVHSI